MSPYSDQHCLRTPDAGRFFGDMRFLFARESSLLKRLMDIVGALVLIILSLPVTLAVAAYIKIVSPGPLFFRQTRIGLSGKGFECIKFRTMKPNADNGNHRAYLAKLIHDAGDNGQAGLQMQKLQDDPQIIPGGNLIREAGLDEFPQLINVLRGDMSLVGPRPPIPYEVEQYKLWYMKRFDVLPGLTGLWQVSGKNRLTFNEMIRLDIRYAEQRCLLLDLKIVLLTPVALFVQFRDYLNHKKLASKPSTNFQS